MVGQKNCLFVGCGYLGVRVAKKMLGEGWTVHGTTRSAERTKELASLGIEPIIYDWLDPNSHLPAIEVDALLVSVSHSQAPNCSPEETHTLGLEHLQRDLMQKGMPSKAVYISTTGVFGDIQSGDWIDETHPACPNRPGGIAASAAESWLARKSNDPSQWPPTTILRPAGLYGPNRVPNLTSLQMNRPLPVAPSSFLNLIHIEDVACLTAEALQRRLSHDLYHLADNSPPTRREYYEWICQQIGCPPPLFDSTQVERSKQNAPTRSKSDGTRKRPQKRGGSNKRIANTRMQNDFQHALVFPDFKSGLAPLLL